MFFTKDNVLNFIKGEKYVVPADIASKFNITTTLSSVTLSQLVKEKKIFSTSIKAGENPYFLHIEKKEVLIELGEKILSGLKKELFNTIKNKQIINEVTLTIQQKLAINEMVDFVKKIEFEYKTKKFIFFVWFLRDLENTKKEIISALENSNKVSKPITEKNENENGGKTLVKEKTFHKNEIENIVENYLSENNFKIKSKKKEKGEIEYELTIIFDKFEIEIEAIIFENKVNQKNILEFYSKSSTPKLIFLKNISKAMKKNLDGIKNLGVIELS